MKLAQILVIAASFTYLMRAFADLMPDKQHAPMEITISSPSGLSGEEIATQIDRTTNS